MIEQDFGLLGEFDSLADAQGDANEDKPVTPANSRAPASACRWTAGSRRATCSPSCRCRPATPRPASRSPAPCCWSTRRRRPATPPAPAASSAATSRRATPTATATAASSWGPSSAPLRLRLLQALPNGGSGPLKDPLTVEVRHKGFDERGPDRRSRSRPATPTIPWTRPATRQRRLRPRRVRQRFSVGDGLKARIPVPLLDDQPVVLAVNVAATPTRCCHPARRPGSATSTRPGRSRTELFREINDLAAKPDKRAETMKKIEEGDRAQPRRLRPTQQGARRSWPRKGRSTPPLRGSSGEDQRGRPPSCRAFLDKLKKIDAEENDPQKKKWLGAGGAGQAAGVGPGRWTRPSPCTTGC